jgi:hypothetical protein
LLRLYFRRYYLCVVAKESAVREIGQDRTIAVMKLTYRFHEGVLAVAGGKGGDEGGGWSSIFVENAGTDVFGKHSRLASPRVENNSPVATEELPDYDNGNLDEGDYNVEWKAVEVPVDEEGNEGEPVGLRASLDVSDEEPDDDGNLDETDHRVEWKAVEVAVEEADDGDPVGPSTALDVPRDESSSAWELFGTKPEKYKGVWKNEQTRNSKLFCPSCDTMQFCVNYDEGQFTLSCGHRRNRTV